MAELNIPLSGMTGDMQERQAGAASQPISFDEISRALRNAEDELSHLRSANNFLRAQLGMVNKLLNIVNGRETRDENYSKAVSNQTSLSYLADRIDAVKKEGLKL